MHHTSTLHSVQPSLVSTPRANFLFSAIAISASFLRKLVTKSRNKKNTDAANLVHNYVKNDDAFAESFLVSEPLIFRQYTLERVEGKVVHFGKWCRMVHSENLPDASPSNGNSNLTKTAAAQNYHSELVYPELSRREGSQLQPIETSSNNYTTNSNTNSFMKTSLRKSKFVCLVIALFFAT